MTRSDHNASTPAPSNPAERSYTNSALKVARSCLRKFSLQYDHRLELDLPEDREALQVGTTWHKAQHARALKQDPYEAIERHAPSPEWAEKLRRLFAAYIWYHGGAYNAFSGDGIQVIEPECTFEFNFAGYNFAGQIDGIVRTIDGRRGIIEYKTTSEDLSPDSSYWDRLRLDTQVGLYAVAASKIEEDASGAMNVRNRPEFILYDAVRKPTIRPKALVKADVARMQKEIAATGGATYFCEAFTEGEIADALAEGRESLAMYGARLTADIGDQPGKYFARREIPRTSQDYETLLDNVLDQVRVIEFARDNNLMHRNPDACDAFGLCQFFGLCSKNIEVPIDGSAPDGYRIRAHLHPELARDEA